MKLYHIEMFAIFDDGASSPIIGFDDAGYALILAGSDGRLIRACDAEGFKTCGFEKCEEFSTIPFGKDIEDEQEQPEEVPLPGL